MGRFVKHSDVQTQLLPALGLPHIDLAYNAHSVEDAEVIADEEDVDAVDAVVLEPVNYNPAPARASSSAALSALSSLQSQGSMESITIDDGEAMAEEDNPMHGGSADRGSAGFPSRDGFDCDGGGQLVAVPHEEQLQLVVQNTSRWHRGKIGREQLVSLSQQDYLKMTHARAAVVGAQASAALLKVSNLLAAANKWKRSAMVVLGRSRSAKKLDDEHRAKETESQSSLVLSTKPSGKRLTAQATLALGIRRNIAHVAAADFGALLMQDISGSTVLRAEVRTGAALVASMRDHVSTAMSLLRESSEFDAGGIDVGADGVNLKDIAYVAGRWHLLFISVRADATNSSIWRREKLHVTEAEIGVVKPSVKDFPTSSDEFLKVRRCLQGP